MKKFLMVFYYNDIGPQHLYKGVGSIPFWLSKECGWKSTFAYVNINGEIHDTFYESVVRLLPVPVHKNPYWSICKFIWQEGAKYDALGFCHLTRQNFLLVCLARLRNKHIKIYVKLDLGRNGYSQFQKKKTKFLYKLESKLLKMLQLIPDICTVESKSYVDSLNDIPHFKGRIKYLPNGFWKDENIPSNLAGKKKKIILTVGRLGTYQKNTELLLDSFAAIPQKERKDWKLILVGAYTHKIMQKGKEMMSADPSLEGKFIFTGNINNKVLLNRYYSEASIFCLPSRAEGSPVVLAEAIHHGCFPILTDCFGAVYELLNEGKNGDIIPIEDGLALTEALIGAMRNIKQTIIVGMQGKSFFDQTFEWKELVKQLQPYLEDDTQK